MKIKKQIVASTVRDAQNEKLTKQELEHLMIESNKQGRINLGYEHNSANKSSGWIENFRICKNNGNEDEWDLIADLYLDNDTDYTFNGISYSTNTLLPEYINRKTTFDVYLPYPFYMSAAFIKEIKFDDDDIGIGKWQTKSASLGYIGIIISSLALVVGPEWDVAYKEHIRPKIMQILSKKKNFEAKKVRFDYVQQIKHPSGYIIEVTFIHTEKVMTESFRYSYGIAEIMKYIKNDLKEATRRQIRRIKMKFKSDFDGYQIWMIEYKDEEVVYFFD